MYNYVLNIELLSAIILRFTPENSKRFVEHVKKYTLRNRLGGLFMKGRIYEGRIIYKKNRFH